mgnify:CR=1 FL=1|jgi:hypothetical protein
MEILTWLGTIFSGFSLAFDIKGLKDKKESGFELIKSLKLTADKLKLCKSIHSCYQEVDYRIFDVYFRDFKGNIHATNKSIWYNVYSIYNNTYKRNSLNILIEKQLSETKAKQTKEKQTKEIKSTIEKLGLNDNILIINTAYPILIGQINELNSIINEYNTRLKEKDEFLTSKHEDMNEIIKEIILNADITMQSLIEIYIRVMQAV